MHQRLMRAVEDGDIEVIDVWEEGDGIQDVSSSFVKRKVAKVLMELLSDERMAGRKHFGFKLSLPLPSRGRDSIRAYDSDSDD